MSFQSEQFGTDLTQAARRGKLDPIAGRDAEIARIIRILARKTKNNALLLGPPGVGKTALVEGLALRIATGDAPAHLRDRSIFSLHLGNLLAGTGYRGDFEQRLNELVTWLQKPGARRILFVDEIHLLGRAGKSEGGLDAGNLLKPLLARGELPCIGASTPAEWQTLVEDDPALERRFQPVAISEPSSEQALLMLRALRPHFEKHHQVEICDDALHAAIRVSGQCMPDRRLPDRAIDLLDEACAALRLSHGPAAHPANTALLSQIAEAETAFDLTTLARLRYRELPALSATRPRLDAARFSEAGSG